MTGSKRIYFLVLPILLLALAALACGTGYRTTQKISGNSGEVRVRMNEADGVDSTSVEINEDWSRVRVTTTVTLSVDSGTCLIYLTGEDGSSINLDATAGSPGEIYGDLVTDVFGEVDLQTDCQNAQNLDLTIYFAR
jgi:hypothetical protein